jgi:hypothetical protein
VKPLHYIALAGILLLSVGYVVLHRLDPGLAGSAGAGSANMVWHKVDRSGDGFQVEMPSDVKQIQVPAYNENGGAEPANMIFANPDAETTFSVAWADNPPVARTDGRTPDRTPERTLEMAQEGALARTQTSLASAAANNAQGFPGRDFTAGNAGGGVMNSRLVYAGSRLYMLVAAFPSAGARRDRDVTRFFNSFTILSPSGNPQDGGAATSN